MRKHQQKQIREIVDTLKQAVEEVKRFLVQCDFQAAINLLADCQMSAVRIGEFVESELGGGSKTVACLEEFCDALYEVGASVESGNHEAMKKLKRQLIAIESCLLTELKPDTVEIVFFPYKAEMWDSMESVWRAATEDARCDVHVVPIPYFNRLPDGTLGSLHVDDGMFPSTVKTTDWRAYNLEERHPDVVFIHNPYDNGNYVTTVHPDYYASELKKHTDLLCYIPYFVAPEIVEEQFCVLSGVQHADRVFLQSEELRQFYIRTIRGYEKERKSAGSFGKLEKKIVASGSPKFDKAILSRPEDYPLPEDWQRRIERPDGSKKNIVLYCTSLGSLLRGDGEYLKKLEYELRNLGGREDIALWWRPHPLQGATYKAMRPQLLEAYQGIITRYRECGWGIYDDTPDMHRALQYGSVYYGDWSSLLLLFGVTGRRIMLHEPGLIEKRGHLRFDGITVDQNGNAWGRDPAVDGAFSLDFVNHRARFAVAGEALSWDAPLPPVPPDGRQNNAIEFPGSYKTVHLNDIYSEEANVNPFKMEAEDAGRVADSLARYRKGDASPRWEDFILRESACAHELFGMLGREDDSERAEAQKRAFLSLTASPSGESGAAILKEILLQTMPT